MTQNEAIRILEKLVVSKSGRWLDVGAGTGLFTMALDVVLASASEIYALDKNPHMLYSLKLSRSTLFIEDQNFERELNLPLFDGIVMANTMHTAQAPKGLLNKLITCLKPKGELIIVELDTDVPLKPWVPYPIRKVELVKLLTSLNRKVSDTIENIPMLASPNPAYAVSTTQL